jgi:dihydroorotate dehydrogenase subfamily 2
MYSSFIKPILFRFDPEFVHDCAVSTAEFLGNVPLIPSLIAPFFRYKNSMLSQTVLGLQFDNPVGLAAGFDKDVRLTRIIPSFGFGFMEVGAITALPCAGNSGTHLVRLLKDESIIVYYGLKNIGAQAVYNKIQTRRLRPWSIPTGLNIAKTNHPDIKGEKSVADYVATYRLLSPVFSYVTVNISCPNAQDGCTFQDPVLLRQLLRALENEKKSCPVFLKLSNHLSVSELDHIITAVRDSSLVDGFIVSNLSKDRSMLHLQSPQTLLDSLPLGGISGRPISKQANKLISYLYTATQGAYPIIGLGGIFDAYDAYEKIRAGASLVQIITGLIYGGPATVLRINRGLAELLRRDGYSHISQAVGTKLLSA